MTVGLGDNNPVLILGAGVNGAALARELLLNRVPVCVVDRFDLASGATSKSSRLIHGGLRYLEYGDVRLVRESLAERTRLRNQAPHLVKPLRLSIPVRKRFGGLVTSALRFIGGGKRPGLRWLRPLTARSPERGLLTVRLGLKMYDRFAKDANFPPHSISSVDGTRKPRVDESRFRWLCSYTDGQMLFPERFVVELLKDARNIAAEQSVEFKLQTHSRVTFDGRQAIIQSETETPNSSTDQQQNIPFIPAAVVNATGAWGDATLQQLGVDSSRLFGGTKGSHIITYQPALREALGDGGVYAEAADGRLVFVLPYREGVLIGTTEVQFDAPPEQAVATEDELNYLIDLVNEIFPTAGLTRSDVELHYSGVRPLPFAEGKKLSSVSRDHYLRDHPEAVLPTFTLVGGKLTTARAFADDVALSLLLKLGRPPGQNSRHRTLPGGIRYPVDDAALTSRMIDLASRFSLPLSTIQSLWDLFGNRLEQILEECGPTETSESLEPCLVGTSIPTQVVRWVIRHEWVSTLDDLIERRLMLVDRPGLSRETLQQLAQELVDAGHLSGSELDATVATTVGRLKSMYGKIVRD